MSRFLMILGVLALSQLLAACNDSSSGGGKSNVSAGNDFECPPEFSKEMCDWLRAQTGGGSGVPTTPPSGGFPTPPTYGKNPDSSDGKIFKDLEDGVITRDQAWVYRTQGIFEPSKLPQKYQPTSGSTATDTNPNLASAIVGVLPTLSASAQNEIIPYLLPPTAKNSFWSKKLPPQKPTAAPAFTRSQGGRIQKTFDQTVAAACPFDRAIPEPFPDGSWTYVEDSFFRIWYRRDEGYFLPSLGEAPYLSIINKLKQVLYVSRNRLESLMNKTIPKDGQQYSFTAKDGTKHVWCNGGNDKLDFYLGDVSGNYAGLTVPYPDGCSQRPSFVLLDIGFLYNQSKLVEFAPAHELAHVLQFAYERRLSCEQYANTDEGFANWAAHYVFPDNNKEHDYDSLIRYPGTSLISTDYPGWPFFMALTQKVGVGIVPQFYSAQSGLNPMRALKSVIPGGFREFWPEFSEWAWNKSPFKTLFRQWDQFNAEVTDTYPVATLNSEIKLDGRGEYYFERELELPMGLTRAYQNFLIKDPTIKSIDVSWSDGSIDKEDFHVRALMVQSGSNKTENWDPVKHPKRPNRKTFCFDEPGIEPIEQMVIAFSRSDIEAPWGEWTDSTKIRLRVGANNRPCYKIKGTADVVREAKSGTQGTRPYSSRKTETHYDATFEAERNSDGFLTDRWKLIESSANYRFTGIIEDEDVCKATFDPLCRFFQTAKSGKPQSGRLITCRANFSSGFHIEESMTRIQLDPYTNQASDSRNYALSISPDFTINDQVTFQCTDPKDNFDENIRPDAFYSTSPSILTNEGKLENLTGNVKWSFEAIK